MFYVKNRFITNKKKVQIKMKSHLKNQIKLNTENNNINDYSILYSLNNVKFIERPSEKIIPLNEACQYMCMKDEKNKWDCDIKSPVIFKDTCYRCKAKFKKVVKLDGDIQIESEEIVNVEEMFKDSQINKKQYTEHIKNNFPLSNIKSFCNLCEFRQTKNNSLICNYISEPPKLDNYCNKFCKKDNDLTTDCIFNKKENQKCHTCIKTDKVDDNQLNEISKLLSASTELTGKTLCDNCFAVYQKNTCQIGKSIAQELQSNKLNCSNACENDDNSNDYICKTLDGPKPCKKCKVKNSFNYDCNNCNRLLLNSNEKCSEYEYDLTTKHSSLDSMNKNCSTECEEVENMAEYWCKTNDGPKPCKGCKNKHNCGNCIGLLPISDLISGLSPDTKSDFDCDKCKKLLISSDEKCGKFELAEKPNTPNFDCSNACEIHNSSKEEICKVNEEQRPCKKCKSRGSSNFDCSVCRGFYKEINKICSNSNESPRITPITIPKPISNLKKIKNNNIIPDCTNSCEKDNNSEERFIKFYEKDEIIRGFGCKHINLNKKNDFDCEKCFIEEDSYSKCSSGEYLVKDDQIKDEITKKNIKSNTLCVWFCKANPICYDSNYYYSFAVFLFP